MLRLRIQDRILLLLLGVILPFAAVTIVVVERRLAAEAQTRLVGELEAARSTFQEIRRQRGDELERATRLVAELPYFKAAVADYESGAVESLRAEQVNTIIPVAREIMLNADLDFLAVADTAGLAIVSLSQTTAQAEARLPASVRSIERALRVGGGRTGNLLHEEELLQVSAAPMVVDGGVFGTLFMGRAIDQPFADRVGEMTHSDIVVESGGHILVEARGGHRPGRQTAARKAAARWQPGQPVTPAVLDRPTTVRLADGRYVSLGDPILDPSGNRIGAFHLQRSLDEALRHLVGLRRTMIGIWCGALLAALLLSSWMARQIGRPIRDLVLSTRRIADGDLSEDVPVRGHDELAGLGSDFNRMTRSLRATLSARFAANARLEERIRQLETSNRELKEAQDQLVQAGKRAAIGEMSAGLAHELNQPLTGMKGFARLLLSRLAPDSPQRRTAARIEQAAEHMARIVRGLRGFSRKGQLEKRATDLNQVVRDSLGLIETQLRRNAVRIDLGLTEGLPLVLADSTQLQQVVTNLLSNARDAVSGRADASVRVSTGRRGRHLVIRVEDNGPGVPAEIRHQIWETFFTTKEAGAGTGLGLSISRGIIDNHQGRLGVSSRPGRTVFWLVIPIDRAGAAETPLAEAA